MNNKIYKSTDELAPFIKEMLEAGKSVKLTVTGVSMLPLLADKRDVVEVKKASCYKKYDIILYLRKSGTMVLHRIVKKKKGIYYLCGDNQTEIEYPVFEDMILGKVISYERKGKTYKTGCFLDQVYKRIWCFNMGLRKHLFKALIKIRRKLK